MTEHPNPKRGCGTKATDACYAEGGEMSPDGLLQRWSWVLGDGVNENLYLEIPPRQVIMINPVATLTLGALIGNDWPYEIPEHLQEVFNHLALSTRDSGIADHVGAKFYTPLSFAKEILDYGPSRRISKDMAKELATIIFTEGPIPMLFTHNRVPTFRHEEDRVRALMLVRECYEQQFDTTGLNWDDFDYTGATWLNPKWGMYRGQWTGQNHYMLPIFTTLHIMDTMWNQVMKYEEWRRFKDFFSDTNHVAFLEQPFGMSWLVKVTYTLDGEGLADPDMVDVPGINIINLDEIEEHEETDEQVTSAPLGAD